MKQIGFFIVPSDTQIRRVEHFAQFIADQIHNGLEVQLGGEPLLDGVDDLQLGDAFLFGFEEPLGLIEEARIFERDTHAVRGVCSKRTSLSLSVFT
jgi:hypothetical protein